MPSRLIPYSAFFLRRANSAVLLKMKAELISAALISAVVKISIHGFNFCDVKCPTNMSLAGQASSVGYNNPVEPKVKIL